ncbi:MAG: hypothetical protein ACLR7Z_15695 [Bilophila wadsworthia]
MTFDTFNVLFHEAYRENGRTVRPDARKVSECGHVSILNAIADAVGVRVATLPSLRKIESRHDRQGRRRPYGQEPWDLGCSLYERLAFLKARHAGKGKG